MLHVNFDKHGNRREPTPLKIKGKTHKNKCVVAMCETFGYSTIERSELHPKKKSMLSSCYVVILSTQPKLKKERQNYIQIPLSLHVFCRILLLSSIVVVLLVVVVN